MLQNCCVQKDKDIEMKTIVKILQNMFLMGLTEESNQPLIDADKENFIRVAAGDPAQDAYSKGLEQYLPPILKLVDNKEVKSIDYKAFIIDGFSMSPENIDNKDILLCKEVSWDEQQDFIPEKFVIIEVDKEYYKFKKKELRFRYKLRKTLFFVPSGWSDKELIDELKKTNDDILLSVNQKKLKEKLRETREYKEYQNSNLVLSTTYRDGRLRYSFHPIEYIKYVGDYCVRNNEKKDWIAEKV